MPRPGQSLAEVSPGIAEDWHPTKNGDLLPNEVRFGSGISVWWLCRSCGYEWVTTPAVRSRGSGCLPCSRKSSRDEQHLAHELSTVLPVDDSALRLKGADGKTWLVDIAIPAIRLVVEYDGSYWHADKADVDVRKTTSLTSAGWTVLRVREEPLPALEGVWCVATAPGQYKEAATAVFAALAEREFIPPTEADRYAAEPGLRRGEEAEQALTRLRTGRAA